MWELIAILLLRVSLVILHISDHADSHLPLVVFALNQSGRGLGSAQYRQQHRRQNRDNRDDNEKFNERESDARTTILHGLHMTLKLFSIISGPR